LAVVFAARTLAEAASRVSLAAIVRLRRPVDFDGDLAAVERRAVRVEVLLRAVLVLRAAGLRAVLLRAAGLRDVLLRAVLVRVAGVEFVVVVLVVVVFSAILLISPSWVRLQVPLYRT
jgi:hypothetical protein